MSKNQKIQPHLHLDQSRSIKGTNEVIFVQEGELLVNFYKDRKKNSIEKTITLKKGDLIYLKGGIHGFDIGEDCEFIEIKQVHMLMVKIKLNYINLLCFQCLFNY